VGIGLIANAWDAFGPDLVSEDRIQREIERVRTAGSLDGQSSTDSKTVAY
jgi:hypothetical protein